MVAPQRAVSKFSIHAVSTESPVAKMQVATWLPAKNRYEQAGTIDSTRETGPSINRHVCRAEALDDDIDRLAGTSLDKGVEPDKVSMFGAGYQDWGWVPSMRTKSGTSQTQLSRKAFQGWFPATARINTRLHLPFGRDVGIIQNLLHHAARQKVLSVCKLQPARHTPRNNSSRWNP